MAAPTPAPSASAAAHKVGEFDVQLKLLLIGDSGVGKSSLLQRYTDDKFASSFISTIGIDFKIKALEIDGQRVRCQIWDTAGQERFRTITTSYFRGAGGIALCFDTTDIKSFRAISSWMAQIAEHADEGVRLVLVGTKSDATPPAVTLEEAEALAAKHATPDRPIPVFWTSAKQDRNVNTAFEALAGAALTRYLDASGAKKAPALKVGTDAAPAQAAGGACGAC